MKPTEWTTVVPPDGEVAATAAALLALARTPADVRTARGGNEFLVPSYLADAYTRPAAKTPVEKAPTATPPRRRTTKKEADA